MKIHRIVAASVAVWISAAAVFAAETVVTVQHPPSSFTAADITVMQGDKASPVTRLERLSGDLADMQLFVLLDDSTRSASLGTQISALKTFLNSLPATTQVAVGYMRNGTYSSAQTFTTDHAKAAHSVRLPVAMPGENGSPYFALSDLVKHWPSKQPSDRRAVIMFTDGIDRYYDQSTVDDPYVHDAIRDSLKNNVAIYSVYLVGAGMFGRGSWSTTLAQSRLMQLSDQTGGYSYDQNMGDPVTIAPFLEDFHTRLDNQYRLTFDIKGDRGVQAIKLRTELPGLKIEGPSRVYQR